MNEFVLLIENEYFDCFVNSVKRWGGEVLCYEERDDYWTLFRVKVAHPVDLFFVGKCYMCNQIAQDERECYSL